MAWLDEAGDGNPAVVSLPAEFGRCHLARDHAGLRFDEVAFTFDLPSRLPPAPRA